MEAEAVFCAACGSKLEPGANFCTACGAPQGQNAAVVMPEPAKSSRPSPPETPRPKSPVRPPSPLKAPAPPRAALTATPAPHRADPVAAPAVANAPLPERAPTAAAAAGGGVGTLVANIFIMALAWAVAWALADFVSQVGIFGLENLSYDLEIMRQNAGGGVIGGALAGFSLSLLFFGATVWGWLRIGVTIVFWVLSELFLVRNWDSLGIETIEGFLVIIGLFGLLYGLIFALLLVGQKPGWGNVVRVPVAAIALMLAAVLGRYLQYSALG